MLLSILRFSPTNPTISYRVVVSFAAERSTRFQPRNNEISDVVSIVIRSLGRCFTKTDKVSSLKKFEGARVFAQRHLKFMKATYRRYA